MSATELLYFTDPAVAGSATVVSLGQDNGREYVVLDRTLFHPGGGGQKSDLGTISGVPMTRAEKRQAEVFHFLGAPPSFSVGDVVAMEIDGPGRLVNSRWHTAGHLVGSVVEQALQCTAVAGQHWPGESFMRFDRDTDPTPDDIDRCRQLLEAAIREDRPVTVAMDGTMRLVTIAGFPAVPCGGTHVAGTAQIGQIELAGVRVKKQHLIVDYRVPGAASAG